MKKSTKAALLSALVFPGVGHFFLKKRIMGAALAVISVLGLSYIIAKILEMTTLIVEKMQSDALLTNAQPDILLLQEWVMAELTNADNQYISLAMSVIMVCWFVATIDSYRIGLAADKQPEGDE